jgi:type III secretory pathway component EscS
MQMLKNLFDISVMLAGIMAVLVLATIFLGSELWHFSKQSLKKLTKCYD